MRMLVKQISLEFFIRLGEYPQRFFFSEVKYFILLNNSLKIDILICFMYPTDMILFHHIQKFI